MRLRTRFAATAIGLTAAMVGLTACSGTASSAPTATAAAGGVDLKAAGCPATVVIQTDWAPEAEHGSQYALLGKQYTIDASKKSVSGPLMSGGKATGVNVEIRAGGPAIAFSTVSAQMAKDPSITLGYIGTDENIELSATQHNTAVMAPLNNSPFMIMWDPATYPAVTDLKTLNAALTKSGGKVIYSAAQAAYMPYLLAQGILSKSNLNGGYNDTPAQFVAAKGKSAQQGFVTSEPYSYENTVAAWKKPVKTALIKDSGWAPYTSALSVPTAKLSSLSGCLKKLVPVLQQADVDFFKDPTPAVDLILKLTTAYKLGFPYSQGAADYAVKTMQSAGLVGNGDDGAAGGMSEQRVSDFIKVAVPTFTSQKITSMNPKVTAADIFTDQFIDKSIKF